MLFYLLDCVIIELIKSDKEIYQAIILKFIYVANPISYKVIMFFLLARNLGTVFYSIY